MNLRKALWTIFLAFALGAPGAWAQQSAPSEGPQSPAAPEAPLGPGGQPAPLTAATSAPAATTSSDTSPLTGAGELFLGSGAFTHDFLQPRLDYYQESNSNALYTVGTTKLVALYAIYGGVTLRRTFGRSEFSLDYAGGGILAPGLSQANTLVEQFTAADAYRWQRWSLLLEDQYSYMPESPFGSSFGDLGNFGGIGGNIAGSLVNPGFGFTPNQSVLTSRSGRISNAYVSQLEYRLSRRSSLTVTGSYASLRFAGPGLFNSSEALLQLGYDHKLSRQDTVGVIYRYGGIRLSGRGLAVLDYTTELAYERKIGSRFAIRVAAGPEVSATRVGLTGSQSVVFLGVDSALQYRLMGSDLRLAFDQGTTGGAGVLPGAVTDLVQASVERGFRKIWHGSVSMGYAENQSLVDNTGGGTRQRYDTWFGNVELSRPVGRDVSLFLRYTEQIQNSRFPLCTGLTCGSNLQGHQVTIGFSWQRRPIELP